MTEAIEPKIEAGWKAALEEEFSKAYFFDLKRFLLEERARHIVYPPGKQIFSAFDLCPPDKVKVVLLGQDPYHGPGQANGLCFSVGQGVKHPPSLVNIYKELSSDLNCEPARTGDLSTWAKQGVLLLNTTLTVRAASPASHQGRGWEQFTDSVIRYISDTLTGVVFLLWGRPAQTKERIIDASKHFILKAPHPSPLSAYSGFFGCRHFSYTNKILIDQGKEPIHWELA